MRQTGWLAGLAFWLNAAWETWVPFYGIEGVALALIVGGWLSAVLFSLRSVSQEDAGLVTKVVRVPLFALGGWLNAAASVNLLIAAEVYGVPFLGDGSVTAALVILTGSVLAAGIIVWRTRSLTYAAALAWGLYAIHVANKGEEALLANAALGAISLLGLALITGWVQQLRQKSA